MPHRNTDTCRKGGHPWVEENIYTSPKGQRTCRECRKISARRHQSQRKRTRRIVGDVIDPRDRAFIYIRDGKRCLKCGSTDNPTIDHIVPVTLGGENHWTNYQTLCAPCNASKGATIADYRPNDKGQLWLVVGDSENSPDEALIQRFEEKIRRSGGCWIWTASNTFSFHGHPMTPSRASWKIYRDAQIGRNWVIRDCGNFDCVNPDHLRAVKPGDHSPATRETDVCRKGHPIIGENVAIDCGVKRCRKCRNDKQRRYNARKRQLQTT